MRLAIDICGGAVRGAAFSIGAYQALNELLHSRLDSAECYMGRSSGSVLASFLANNIRANRIISGLRKKSVNKKDNFSWEVLFGKGAKAKLRHLLGNPLKGYFSLKGLEEYVRKELSTYASNSFQELEKELIISAVELQTGKRKLFDNSTIETPISEAVIASCGFPVLFRLPEIDGKTYADGAISSTTTADAALERGYDMAIVINPARNMNSNLRKISSFWDIGEQVVRTILHESALRELRLTAKAYPGKAIFLIEPDEADDFVSKGSFSFWGIDKAIDHGRERVFRIFEDHWDVLYEYFGDRGIKMYNRSLSTLFMDRGKNYRHTPTRLDDIVIA
ncbi:MAG: patatin-like phospholipase family protein [Candidatus Woesearchaeota archaeon]